jgi:hypothetical protein
MRTFYFTQKLNFQEAPMLKTAGFLLLLPTALIAGMWTYTATSPSAPESREDWLTSQEAFGANLNRRIENRRIFVRLMDPTLKDLGDGKVTLRQAAEKIMGYSRLHHGDYLANVAWAEEGVSLLEKVARNCVRHFRISLDGQQNFVDTTGILPRLEQQLAEVIREEGYTGR